MQSSPPPQPTQRSAYERPLWVIAAGLCFMALGNAARPRQGNDGNELQTMAPIAAGGTADSNGSMIAVTGMDLTGQSVLYLIDTEQKQLAVYQASGGANSTMGVKFVGGRRIDLDLQLEGFNDRTEIDGRPLKHADLERMFAEQGLAPEK